MAENFCESAKDHAIFLHLKISCITVPWHSQHGQVQKVNDKSRFYTLQKLKGGQGRGEYLLKPGKIIWLYGQTKVNSVLPHLMVQGEEQKRSTTKCKITTNTP